MPGKHFVIRPYFSSHVFDSGVMVLRFFVGDGVSIFARDGDLYGVTWNPRALPSDGARREYGAGNARSLSAFRSDVGSTKPASRRTSGSAILATETHSKQ